MNGIPDPLVICGRRHRRQHRGGRVRPGLVQCGSIGAKVLIGWEVMNAVGDVATAGKHYSEGNFGWGDVLAQGGAGLSMKGLIVTS